MELKIGVTYTARELELEIAEEASAVADMVEQALAEGARMVWFVDNRGRRVGVVTEKLAYLEFGTEDSQRVVGFG